MKEQVFKLAQKFLQYGHTAKNEQIYQSLDEDITTATLDAAKKVGRRKHGYMRNDRMTTCGRMVILYKMILDYKTRRTPPTAALLRLATTLQVTLEQFEEMMPHEICK